MSLTKVTYSMIDGAPANVKDYGAVGNGVADDTAAIQAAIDANPGKQIVLSGTFLVSDTITISDSSTWLVGQGDTQIIAEVGSFANGQAVLKIEGTGQVATTTLTSSVSLNATSLPVTSAAGMTSGAFIVLASDGEYWNGITGVSGFGRVNKSELNRIQQISGTTVTTEWNLSDSYSTSGYTVNVRTYSFIDNVKVIGISFYGTGDGSANLSAAVGPEAISAFYVNDLEISSCRIENFNYGAIRTTICNDVRIANNEILGRDSSDPTNLPNISPWFYGISFIGTCNFVCDGNTGQNLRRLVDVNFTSNTTIPRNGTVSANTVVASSNGLGTHQAEFINFVGNTILSSGGIYIRGKNCTVVGNIIDNNNGTTSAAGIVFGGNLDANYSENPSSGHIVVSGNNIRTQSAGIFIRTDVESGVISDNVIRGGTNHGVWFTPKRTKDLLIKDNMIDITNRSGVRHNIYFNNVADRCVELERITISNNTLKNGADGVRVEAPVDQANAANNIYVTDNFFSADVNMTTAARFTPGYFANGIVFRNNAIGVNATSGGVVLSTDRYQYSEWPDVGENKFFNIRQEAIAFRADSLIPIGQTALAGQRIINTAPAPGGYMGWVCTTSGTAGTISRTGSITSGTATLTVDDNSALEIFVGCFVLVTGAGVAGADLIARVTAVSGNNATLNTNASTTVSGVAVAYSNPVFKGYGAIEA